MRFFFNRKNNAITGTRNSIWQKFEQANLRLQHKCANWLERKTAHFSRLNWIVVLFTFIVFTGGCSIYAIVSSFSDTTGKNITVIPITKPTNSVSLNENDIELNAIISKAELEKIIRFRKYIDSLGRSPTGKKTHDSIVQYRPGLLDSLAILENYYYSHFKN
ncbi:hypothetical protein B0A67_03570 [Flavobacterium aquidurense]|uniref:hypothetical protein n=1 Tax=Flavobacterium aquidurense TaxID=362413 RepID=UPI00091D3BFF|nr:hypothetical protein [Flavobacterium aquidurense]OXA73763.1 hypothetical protein B0A67_03570 [Flavobacterium aquidurense]SHG80059.1 hypothetical protein SAMN05444481_107208 [Flavobacterium frigidimaris]